MLRRARRSRLEALRSTRQTERSLRPAFSRTPLGARGRHADGDAIRVLDRRCKRVTIRFDAEAKTLNQNRSRQLSVLAVQSPSVCLRVWRAV